MDYKTINCPLTANTTRICGDNPVNVSIEISKTIFNHMRPNAIILVNKNEVFDGIAASPLVHFPINASILLTDRNIVSDETLMEIKRLKPKGYNGIQVFLVGNISKHIETQLNCLGLSTHYITGRNHYETACEALKVTPEFRNVIIISGEEYSEGIASSYYSAHEGNPILFVKKNEVPNCTLETLKKLHHVNVYIVGSTKTVSKAVEEILRHIKNIKQLKRIHGDTPYSIAVNFAMYRDEKTEFGWGRNYVEGHAFTFGTLSDPMNIIPGVAFAHMGKHTPLLLIKTTCIPQVVEKYIECVKPIPPKNMPRPPFMHGFILGNIKDITYDTQIKVENILSIDQHIMEMEGMNMLNCEEMVNVYGHNMVHHMMEHHHMKHHCNEDLED